MMMPDTAGVPGILAIVAITSDNMKCPRCKQNKSGSFHLYDAEYVCDECYGKIFPKYGQAVKNRDANYQKSLKNQ